MSKHKEPADNQDIIYEELPLPEESEDERNNSMQLFCDNLELLLANVDTIISTSEYFHIRHQWSYIGGSYVGSKYIPLGVLVLLWQKNEWLGQCPNCSNQTYIFCAGGSPLSGSHYCHAVCTTCNEIVNDKVASGLAALLKPAFELCNEYSQKRKILRIKGQSFPPSKGVVGEVPVEILEDQIELVDLESLIKRLK